MTINFVKSYTNIIRARSVKTKLASILYVYHPKPGYCLSISYHPYRLASAGAPEKQNQESCCCCSVTKSYPVLCDHMDCSTPDSSVLHCLLEFAQIKEIYFNELTHAVMEAEKPHDLLSASCKSRKASGKFQSKLQGLETWRQGESRV